MTLMVKVESQVCVRVDSHGVRVISQPVQVISKQSASCRLCGVPPFSQREYQLNTGIPPPPPWLQSHLSSSLVASQTYFPSFPRRKKSWEIFYTFISRAPSIIGAEFCNRDGLFMYIIGAATTTRQPVPRSGFVWGKKKSKPDY